MASNETLAAREQLNEDFQVLLKDAQTLLESTKGDLDGKAADARQRLERNLDEMKGKYRDLEGTVSRKAGETAEATERLIRDYPYHSLGISFGVGLLLGMVMRRK